MKVGTRSLLFGVHQFAWHPFTVWRAWRHYYKRTPTFWETVAIIVHDWGYWGCYNMDGYLGKRHPERGALLVFALFMRTHSHTEKNISRALDLWELVRHHSSHYALDCGQQPSALCAPDKLSVLFDPPWFYLLRARLSGEVREYVANSPMPHASPERWLQWYRWKTAAKYL